MKMLLSLGAVLLAISASTISADAACIGGDFGNYFVLCPPTADDVEQPKYYPHKKVHRPAPVHHVAKRPKPRPRDQDEKAPAAVPPPALPPH